MPSKLFGTACATGNWMAASSGGNTRSIAIADFVCAERSLVIELDGGQHLQQQGYDEQRTRHLQANGYRVLRFWNNDVLVNIENVLEAVLEALASPGPSPQPSPRRGEGAKSSARSTGVNK
jgi:hypothetical protein